MKQRVYVCGPYSDGDTICHVKAACAVADLILEKGGIPFIPHLFHFWHFMSHKPKSTWLMIDKHMLHAMHSIVVIPTGRMNPYTSGMKEELDYNDLYLHLPVIWLDKLKEADFSFPLVER